MPQRFDAVTRAIDSILDDAGMSPKPATYPERCANWQRRYLCAIATYRACRYQDCHAYALETLGYIVWLLRRRPFKGDPSLDFFKPHNPEA